MKKPPSPPSTRTRKVACTVSAAALMLGVSHAATIGFNFQNNYCGSTAAYRNNVTATAFGIPASSWQSLTPMMTGYSGPPCDQLSYTLNEVIDTTTSTGGLNPLPNGSVTVNWYAPTANWSNWGGYDRPGPYYDFGGSTVTPGEGEVYAGFLRDGINFGPPGGPDNSAHLPPYNVDIIGLKSLFTNTPFVIELVASSDSMYHLTNAFIVDATASTTQSVIYPNTPIPHDQGDAPLWIRGHGGGLSTVSTVINTDHVKLIGNFPQHSASLDSDKTHSINNASCISGFIITDKPVVTMYPRSVSCAPHDSVNLRIIAAGVPPLSYQWRVGGVPIAGATSSAYSIADAERSGNYDVVVNNLYGSAISKAAAVTVFDIAHQSTVLDSKPSGAAISGADFGAAWVASSTDGASVTRSGVMQFNASHPDQIKLPAVTNFDSTTGTIMFWMRSAGTNGPGTEGAMLFDRRTGSGFVITQEGDGTILVQPGGTGISTLQSGRTISDNNWHQIVVTYDQALSGQTSLFIDGTVEIILPNNGAWSFPAGQQIELGRSHDSYWTRFDGLLDDVRIYNRILDATEIASTYSSGALVDTAALQTRLNFDTKPVPGVAVSWGASGLFLQSATSVTGPFTDMTAVVASPYYEAAQGAQKFFRLRRTTTPITINSNPYDM